MLYFPCSEFCLERLSGVGAKHRSAINSVRHAIAFDMVEPALPWRGHGASLLVRSAHKQLRAIYTCCAVNKLAGCCSRQPKTIWSATRPLLIQKILEFAKG